MVSAAIIATSAAPEPSIATGAQSSLGGQVFFEVVQRIGGYDGYGAANAPVRMAAHRRARLAMPSFADPRG